ncbi:hypothetical protein A3740_12360 [Oleiphilus sp. HI0068]|uniref:hypothetical protein n=1 Tax=Oleiphilus sp. HI0132 TaxID=1822270 RepID=UPI0007C39820|nr:hypothetical protein [Oleiphilus sp. HI0132]KZY76616.1 hypothetical protein A3740_12360 [Oleiphilus sp. HI0068]KZY84246.1 hypothetical protein A3741_16245 [Oleiphilus sp. HI0069]KZZ46593.1 hypothetical protein A3755_18250 [Oleiphilus sp. HI0085]KZZ74280.1 hypothetical protein A3766_18815 [Oleiphilus sp. HI0132]
MRTSIYLVLVLPMMLFVGCSGSSSESSNKEVVGVWLSPCVITGGRIALYTMTVSENEIVYDYVYYSGECEEETGLTSTEIKSYRTGQYILTESGNSALEIDIDIYSDGEFLYTKKDIVSVINGVLYFGIPSELDGCDETELVSLGPTVREFCNGRPFKLDFDSPFNYRI